MKKTRLTAILLSLLMLTPAFAACSESGTNPEPSQQNSSGGTDTPVISEAAETEAAEEHIACDVPADLDLGGESVRFLHFHDQQTYNINVEELNGELLNDAVFASNQKVMEDLNCEFVHNGNGGIEPTNVSNAVKAGDDIYEIVYGTQWKVAPMVSQHLFANLNEKEDVYFDFAKPWWYEGYIHEAEADGTHTYFLAGDASPDVFRRSSMMILNTDLLSDIGRDVNEIYETVLNGEWTFDRLSEIVGSLYVDNNGNGKADVGDTFGFASWTRSDVDHFMIDCGVRGCSRDADGVPYITFNNDTTVKFVETLVNFLWNNTGSYYVEGIPTFEMMENNQALFLCEKFSRLDMIRDMQTDFTIVPVPKLDDTIESYGSLTHDDAVILCVPIVSTRVKTTSAVLEKLGYYYYYDVMPEYYNVILKNKYRRDSSDAASQVIDLIHDSMTTDFAYIYNYGMSNMMLSLRDLIGVTKSTDFASAYKKSEKVYNKVFDKLLTSIREGE